MKFPRLDYVAVEEWLLSYVSNRTVLHLGCAGDLLQHGRDACLHYQLSKICTSLYGIELDKTAWIRLRHGSLKIRTAESVIFPGMWRNWTIF